MILTSATFRVDKIKGKGKKCGSSYIPQNAVCGGKEKRNERLKKAAFVGGAVALGVGAAMLKNKLNSSTGESWASKATRIVQNTPLPKAGKINTPANAVDKTIKRAQKARENRIENMVRGKDPDLEFALKKKATNNTNLRKELQGFKSEMNRLRTEIGVWGPNRIKQFKRKKQDSMWADGSVITDGENYYDF